MIGTAIGTVFAPGIGSLIGGAIGGAINGWFGNERQQEEIETIVERYQQARSKLFDEWELFLQLVYTRLAGLITGIASVQLLSYEAIDKSLEFYNEGNKCWDSEVEEDLEKSIDFYFKALDLNPGFSLAWLKISFVLNHLEQYEEALEAAEQAINIDNTFPLAFNCYGDALKGLEQYQEAIAAYNKSLELDPESCGAWEGKSICLYNLGQYKPAIEACDKVIFLDPESAWGWYFKASCQALISDVEQALKSLQEAIKLDPSITVEMMSQDRDFDVLQQDARFKTLLMPKLINETANLRETVELKVIQIIAEQLGIAFSTIKPGSRLSSDLGVICLSEIIMELEEEFDIEILDEDAEDFVTVDDVVKYIEEEIDE